MHIDELKLVYKLIKSYRDQTSEPNILSRRISNENVYLLRKYFHPAGLVFFKLKIFVQVSM